MPPEFAQLGFIVDVLGFDELLRFLEQGHASLLPRLVRHGRAVRGRVPSAFWFRHMHVSERCVHFTPRV